MAQQTVTDLEMWLYLRHFSCLVENGVNLVNCLETLCQTRFSPPLIEATREAQEKVMAGSTLSLAMSERPEVFSRFLVGMVRAGEVGGVLDETLSRAVRCYEMVRDSQRRLQVALATTNGADEETRKRARGIVASLTETRLLQYYCYKLGILLSSGVPILQALEVAGEQLPERYASMTEELRQELHSGGTTMVDIMEGYGLPATLLTLVRVGEQSGRLDDTLIVAGDLLGSEVETQLQQELETLLPEL